MVFSTTAMEKHPRKRQKKSENTHGTLPSQTKEERLAMIMDDENKDDEERRLESLLFGVKYRPRDGGKVKDSDEAGDQESDGSGEGGGGGGMRHLLDQDLFFVDNSVASNTGEKSGHYGGESPPSESDSQASSSSSSSTKGKKGSIKDASKKQYFSGSKPPAWVDPADTQAAKISLLNGHSRLRKLRQTAAEDEITGREYETRLRSQFEQINPEPAWVQKARGVGKRKKRKTKGDEDEGDEDGEGADDIEEEEGDGGIQDLLTSTSGLLAEKRKHGKNVVLRQEELAIERVRDANHSVQSSTSGEVRVVSFHPKPAVPVLCVATADRRVRLFHIDGHLSPLLSTLHIPSLPLLTDSSVLFHPSGNSLLISGPRPFFYTYDLQQGTSRIHRRGLWSTGFDDTSILTPPVSMKRRRSAAARTSGGGGRGGGGNTEIITHTAFSPRTGNTLAVAGRGGNVHLIDWRSGAGQVVGSLRCTSSGGGGGGGVKGLWWLPSTDGEGDVLGGGRGCGDNEKYLGVLTDSAEMYIWDVGQRRCVRRWTDEGGYRGAGRVIAGGGGPNGWLAIGSTSGYVNVYGSDSFSVPSNHGALSGREKPKMIKALGHLTTPISTLRFNHDAQILAMASKDKKDAFRLVHLPTLTVFPNWPTSSTPLGHVSAVDFATRSEYVAIGNTKGRVLLYHLKDYGAGSAQRVWS